MSTDPTARPTEVVATTGAPTPPPTRGPGHQRSPLVALIALGVLIVLLASGCGLGGGAADPGLAGQPLGTTSTALGDGLQAETVVDPWTDASTRAVVTGGFIEVYDGPGGSQAMTLGPTTAFGTTRVFLVEEVRDGWVKVRLPLRPNHRTGWVPEDQIRLEELDLAVFVDLTNRSLQVRDGDETIISAPVAIGSPENPTPTGTFSVTDKLQSPSVDGPYGPFAIGLSGYSETLTEFAGGDGQIGIHGTNDPTTIGLDVSHGCIRVPNDVIVELADLLALGTPVHII